MASVPEETPLRRIFRILGTPLRLLLSGIIYLYRLVISPILPNSCIYTPTCSAYSIEALKKHGVFFGLILSVTRISRCTGGLFTGGDDPVPDTFSFTEIGPRYRKFRRRKQD